MSNTHCGCCCLCSGHFLIIFTACFAAAAAAEDAVDAEHAALFQLLIFFLFFGFFMSRLQILVQTISAIHCCSRLLGLCSFMCAVLQHCRSTPTLRTTAFGIRLAPGRNYLISEFQFST